MSANKDETQSIEGVMHGTKM